MWQCTCVPRNVYNFLYPFKSIFRCAQAQHFVIFCWLVVAIIRDPDVGTLKGVLSYVPVGLSYWALLLMVRPGQWDAQAVLSGMSRRCCGRAKSGIGLWEWSDHTLLNRGSEKSQ
jgi:hypothetical protein